MTLLNKSLMAVFMSGAMGFAAPALAQSGPVANTSVVADSSTTVARADGSTVVTERVVTRRVMVVPTGCNHSDRRNVSGLRNVSGGIGGSIGGRMILGSTSADDVPLPGTCAPIPR
jgi:hypothetical protein